MIESLERPPRRARGANRPIPPSEAICGLPTLVHNVETLANVPHIVLHGPEWYAAIGAAQSTGPKIFCVSGHVYRRGTYELPLGTPLREIIYGHAGGIPGGRKLKAVIPGGASTPVLRPGPNRVTDGRTRRWPPPARRWARAPSSSRRDHLYGRRGAAGRALFCARVLRALHPLSYGLASDRRGCWSGSRPAPVRLRASMRSR